MIEDQENIIFSSKNDIVCLTYEGGAYYFTVATQEVRGPFFEESEAYQEAIVEISKYLESALITLSRVEDKIREFYEPMNELDNILNGNLSEN